MTTGEEVHRTAHSLDWCTTATMMFGCSKELRLSQIILDRIKRIQEDTGGFTSFIPWIADNTALEKETSSII